jgi:hypothetical protein
VATASGERHFELAGDEAHEPVVNMSAPLRAVNALRIWRFNYSLQDEAPQAEDADAPMTEQ